MAIQSTDCPAADHQGRDDVRIVHVAAGGWDVMARVDGRVVAIRHCGDWHRTERARRCLELALPDHVRDLTVKVAVLLVSCAAPGSDAQAQESATDHALFAEPRVITRAIEFANRLSRSSDGGDIKNDVRSVTGLATGYRG